MAHPGEVLGNEGGQLEAQFLQILRFKPPGEPQQFVGNGTALIWHRTALTPATLSVPGGGDCGSCRLQEGSLEEVTMVEGFPIPQPLGEAASSRRVTL